MSDEGKSRIKMLTGWIIMAFLAFVPNWAGCRMGTAFLDRQIIPIQQLLLKKFSPTSGNISSFLALPTAYCILPTAFFGAVPKNAYLCSSPRTFRPSLKSFRSSPKTFWSCLKSFSPSLERFCPYPGKFCPRFKAVLSSQ